MVSEKEWNRAEKSCQKEEQKEEKALQSPYIQNNALQK